MSKVIRFKTGVALTAYASVVGKKEKQGPLGNCFDVSSDDDYFGCKTWEKAETQMQLSCVEKLLEKRKMPQEQISVALGGDLCNQITGTNYTMRQDRLSLYRLVRRLLHHGREHDCGRLPCGKRPA